MVRCNLKMPRDFAAALLYNSNHTDWRDLIPRINLPALIISGRGNRKSGFIVKSKVHSSKYSKSQKVASTLCSSRTLRS